MSKGTYYLSGAELKSDLELFGDGDATIIYLPDGSNSHVLQTPSSFNPSPAYGPGLGTNIYIHDLRIDGNKSGQTSLNHAGTTNGIYIANCDGVRVERTTVINAKENGIAVYYCKNVKILNNYVSGSQYDNGISINRPWDLLSSKLGDIVVSNNIVSNCTGGGTGQGVGIAFFGARFWACANNIVYGCRYGLSVELEGDPGTVYREAYGTLTGNTLRDCPGGGISAHDMGDITISANHIYNCGSTDIANIMGGISVFVNTDAVYPATANPAETARGISNIAITGNTIDGGTGFGISVGTYMSSGGPYYVRDLSISGNSVKGTSKDAIYLRYAQRFSVGNNVLYKSAGSGNGITVLYPAGATSANGSITGNTVSEMPESGIYANNAYRLSITGNTSFNNGQRAGAANLDAGIRLLGCTQVISTGNMLYDTSGSPTQEYGQYNDDTSLQITMVNTYVTNLTQAQRSGGVTNSRLITYGDAAPTSGYREKGDRHVNISGTVGQPKAWNCTTAGNPGTWTSEGNL
jgi:parallel beta-helix repeat protein